MEGRRERGKEGGKEGTERERQREHRWIQTREPSMCVDPSLDLVLLVVLFASSSSILLTSRVKCCMSDTKEGGREGRRGGKDL